MIRRFVALTAIDDGNRDSAFILMGRIGRVGGPLVCCLSSVVCGLERGKAERSLHFRVAPHYGGWCNWQHGWFWSIKNGFKSCPPSQQNQRS